MSFEFIEIEFILELFLLFLLRLELNLNLFAGSGVGARFEFAKQLRISFELYLAKSVLKFLQSHEPQYSTLTEIEVCLSASPFC